MLKNSIHRVSQAMDNVKIHNKLIILFICCVLIPVVSTNCALYYIVSKKAELERITEMKNIQQRLEYNISTVFEAAESVANQFKKDKVLNEFLNTKYADNMEYYESYSALMRDNAFSYYYQSESVYKISLFTNNKTVTRSSSFYPLSDVVNEEWYQNVVVESMDDSTLQVYYSNPIIKNPYDAWSNRKISIFTQLDSFGEIKKFLKVDISYSNLEQLVFNEKSVQDILIVEDGMILFDTRNGRLESKPLKQYEPIDEHLLQEEETMKVLGNEWKIIVVAERKHFFDNFIDNRILLCLTILINLIIPSSAIMLIGNSIKDRVRVTENYIKELKDGKYKQSIVMKVKMKSVV